MTFQEWWENEECRVYCETHELRAYRAWMRSREDFLDGMEVKNEISTKSDQPCS